MTTQNFGYENTTTCPWCNSRAENTHQNCPNCGGPLPSVMVKAKPDKTAAPQENNVRGPKPPPAPRKLPTGYARDMIFKNEPTTLVGAIFFVVGLPFAIIFPIIGFGSGEWMFTVIGGGLGLLFTLLSAFMASIGIRNGQNKIKPFQYGEPSTGEVVRIHHDRAVTVNGRSPWEIIYQFEVNGTLLEGKEHTWGDTFYRRGTGTLIHVLYMPDNPSQNAIYPPPR